MTDIFKTALEKVDGGARFEVNFQKRTFKLDGKTIIDAGKFEGSLGTDRSNMETVLGKIENLYDTYMHSIPSERSEAGRRRYFRALPEHELSDDDMLYGESRERARLALELYILCVILDGSFVWDDKRLGTWFWQSAKYPSLIILKKWIVNC